MKLIYVAGPFTAPDRAGIDANIAAAVAVGVEVARLGAMPVIPHANTAAEAFMIVQPYPFWIAGTMELLRVCSALVTVPGWERSRGATGEVAEAGRLGLPRFHTIAELAQWLRPSLPISEAAFHELVADEDEDKEPTLPTGIGPL